MSGNEKTREMLKDGEKTSKKRANVRARSRSRFMMKLARDGNEKKNGQIVPASCPIEPAIASPMYYPEESVLAPASILPSTPTRGPIGLRQFEIQLKHQQPAKKVAKREIAKVAKPEERKKRYRTVLLYPL